MTNAKGDAFAAKALTKYVRKVCGVSSGDALEDATTTHPTLQERDATVSDRLRATQNTEARASKGSISPALLHERFPQIKGAYTQQALDYGKNSRYGGPLEDFLLYCRP